MSKQTYIALVALNVHHVLIVPGASVDLTDEEAAGALAVNAVTTQAALDEAAAERQAQADAAAAAMQASVQALDPVKAAKDAAKEAAKNAAKAGAAK
jgi:hypothetical protein